MGEAVFVLEFFGVYFIMDHEGTDEPLRVSDFTHSKRASPHLTPPVWKVVGV